MKQIVKDLSIYIEKEGQKFIKEGKAIIQTSKVYVQDNKKIEEEVFYNPAQIFNRDLTVLVIDTFSEGRPPLTIVDALSASGLRSVRFAQEIKNVKEIYANDISLASLTMIEENIKLNGVTNVKTHHMCANKLMNSGLSFDVIDLDPYGSVTPFLDSALHACDDTLLCITCTDSRVLCGPDQQKCFTQYGTARCKMNCFAENGIRTLLYAIGQQAGRFGKTMTPLISIFGEFYLRVFVHIQKNKAESHKLITQIGNVMVCPQCYSYQCYPYGELDRQTEKSKIFKVSKEEIKGICSVCESKMRLNGPVWLGELNCVDFVGRMLKNLESNFIDFQTFDKIQGKLQGIELQKDLELHPYSYNINQMASLLKCSNLSKKEIYSGFQSLGYLVQNSYLQRDEFKTNAPPQAAYDIIKSWKQKHQLAENYLRNIVENSVAQKILSQKMTYEPDLEKKVKIQETRMFFQDKLGPKSRAIQKKVIDQQ